MLSVFLSFVFLCGCIAGGIQLFFKYQRWSQIGVPKLCNIYSQGGEWFFFKKWAMFLLLTLKQLKEKKKNKGFTVLYDREEAQRYRDSEKPQKLKDSPYAIDSVYFYGSDGNGLSFILRFARRHERAGEFWFLLRLPDGRHFEHLGCPDTQVYNCSPTQFQTDGLRIFCEEPMRRWRLIFCGFMKDSDNPNSYVQIALDTCFRGFTNPFDVEQDLSKHLIAEGLAREPWSREFFDRLQNEHDDQEHLEQWGSFTGNLQVEKETFSLHLRGYRDHSYGTRNWVQYYRYAAHFAHFEDGSSVSVGSVSLPKTTTQIRYGYYFTSYGAKWPITSHNFNLWEHGESKSPGNQYRVKFVANGKKFILRLHCDRNFKFLAGEQSSNMIIERFANYTLNNIKGHGVSEYCYRNFSSPNVMRQPSLPHLNDRELKPDDPTPLVVAFSNDLCQASALSGGKGCQLGLLTTVQGVEIPSGFVVTTSAYRAVVSRSTELKTAIRDLEDAASEPTSPAFNAAQQKLVSLFTENLLPSEVVVNIKETAAEVFGDEFQKLRFAVRSSAVGEDGEDASGAGQMETFLGVTASELHEKIAKCWASQFGLTAVNYRLEHGFPVDTKMAVVVQRMVDAEAAGVLFTQHPRTCSANHLVIESNFGLGESVVSGECTPDSFEVTRYTDEKMEISFKKIGAKETKFAMQENGGAGSVDEKGEESEKASLTDEQILRLARLGRLLEKHFGNPRDIEWAVKGDNIFILQARAITTTDLMDENLVHEFDGSIPHDAEYLTTANIGEMMPGAVTPLTASIFARAVDVSLQGGLYNLALLSEVNTCNRFLPTFCNHIFLNITTMGCMTQIHMYSSELKMMYLALFGRVLDKPKLEELEKYNGRSPLLKRIRNLIVNGTRSYLSKKKTEGWEKRLADGYHIRPCYTAAEQLEAIDAKLDDYYRCWFDTVRNSGNSAIGTMIVMRLIADGSGWNNELYSKVAAILSTCEDVFSADVPAALRRLSSDIAHSKQKEQFLEMEPETAVKWLLSTRSGQAGKQFRAFLYRHGHRCVREAEMREIPWRQQPEKVVTVIRTIIESGSFEATTKKEMDDHELMELLPSSLNPIKRWLLPRFVRMARRGVGLREWGKSISIEFSDVFKQAFQHLGQLLETEKILPDADLVYFINYEELHCLVRSGNSKLIAKARRRRNTLTKQMEMEFQEIAQGIPQALIASPSESRPAGSPGDGLTLSGMPVSRGEIDGRARVVKTLEQAASIRRGEILIVPYTDVGWSPYFPLIGGLVTEKGGLLSHGAVVAREYGLPCVVSCKQATSVFNTGDFVRLNGTRGTIQRITE